MPDRVSKRVLPHRAILASSLLFGVCSIGFIKFARSESFLFGISLGVLLVCFLPWLVVLRRSLWSRHFPDGGRWMTVVAALLWVSLLIGPVVTGSFWVSTQLSGASDGMARLSNTIGALVFGVVSFSAAYFLAGLAFLIQLWRDQWRTKLTGVTIACLFLLFVAYAWSMRPSNGRAEQAASCNHYQPFSFDDFT